MKKMIPLTLIAIMVFGLAACAQPISGSVLQSDKQRLSTPITSQTNLATQIDGNSTFAFDLYQALRNTDGNIFYSPYSISIAWQ